MAIKKKMVALFITLDLHEIRKFKLNLNEYLTLMRFQHDAEGRFFPFEPDERYFPRLLEDKFITESPELKDGKQVYLLGSMGEKVFKGDDLFEEFYAVYPHKVNTEFGFRPVSTTDPNSASAKITRGIWDRIVKNKPYLQCRIINNLKRELEYRKNDNSMAYLQGIDTWLRQATWEKWNDIPDKRNSDGNYVKL